MVSPFFLEYEDQLAKPLAHEDMDHLAKPLFKKND
jgi:hypothetical protein